MAGMAEPAAWGGALSSVLCHLLKKQWRAEQSLQACLGKHSWEAESTRLRCRQTGQNFNQERNLGRSWSF